MRKAGSAGKPAINVETRVVNTAMEDVKVGEVGEIVHRSPHLLSGYYNDPVKTAAAFAGGWFHSGDLATVDADGYITVVDRKKDMIKTGGENVASREVEETIYRMPAVSEVAVVGLPDPRWIEAVTAIVVVKTGATLDEDSVIKHCAGADGPLQGAQARRLRRQPAEESQRQAARSANCASAISAARRSTRRSRRISEHDGLLLAAPKRGAASGGEFWRGARLDAAWQIVFRRACEYARARGRSRGDLRCHPH